MKVIVTGATGFVGQHVVENLLQQPNVTVVATSRDTQKAQHFAWYKDVTFLPFSLESAPDSFWKHCADADHLIHLAWSGLPNYKALFHFEQNLMPQYFFLKKAIATGVKDLTVTGTCFEYGLQNGPLTASTPTHPQTPYALAKDTLHHFLRQLQTETPFSLKWIRLFYMYGRGQSPKSILSLLDKALDNGETSFDMSGGEQLRDYLPIEAVADNIVQTALRTTSSSVTNCCSGMPISIRNLVERHLQQRNRQITLNLGVYPYPDYEPMAFWGIQ